MVVSVVVAAVVGAAVATVGVAVAAAASGLFRRHAEGWLVDISRDPRHYFINQFAVCAVER